MSRLVIGVGNPLRGDDGVGACVAQRVRASALAGVEVREATGEGAALMELWRDCTEVVLIDAVSGAGEPGRIHRFVANEQPIPAGFFRYSTHAFSVAEAIELARVLGTLPPRLVVYGITGETFAPGIGLSSPVAAAVEPTARAVLAELDAQRRT